MKKKNVSFATKNRIAEYFAGGKPRLHKLKKIEDVQLRRFFKSDMPWIRRIESDNSLASGKHEFTNREILNLLDNGCEGIVAEEFKSSGQCNIMGWLLYMKHPSHIQLLNICVHSDDRRRGVGASLLAHLAVQALSKHRTMMVCHASEDDYGVQMFLKSCDFMPVSITEGICRYEYHS